MALQEMAGYPESDMYYAAILTREGPNTLVEFPDCPGCQTFGRGRAQAIANAGEALEGWLEAHLISGDAPPPPRRRAGVRSSKKDLAFIPIAAILAVRLQLRWARQAAGLSQADLASRVGVSRQQIALLESPDANVTLRTLERVARALHLRLDVRLVDDASAA